MRESCRSSSFPRGKNFPRVTCIGEGEGESKKVSFTRERTAVGSNPLGNEKTNGSESVRNRIRSATFPWLCLPFILSLHDTRTRRPLDRCLFGRRRDVYIARTVGIGRSASFKRRARLYIWKRERSLFFTSQYPRFRDAPSFSLVNVS